MAARRSRILFFRLLVPFVAVIVLAFSVCAWIAIRAGSRSLGTMVQNDLRSESRVTLDKVGGFIEEHIREVQSWGRLSIMEDVLIGDRVLRIEHLLLELYRENEGQYLLLEVSDRQGRVVAATDISEIGRVVDLVDRAVGSRVDSGEFLIARPGRDGDVGRERLEIAAPIRSRLSGDSIGWIVGHLAWKPVQEIVTGAEVVGQPQDSSRFLVLTDGSGHVLAGNRNLEAAESITLRPNGAFDNGGAFLVSQAAGHTIDDLVGDRLVLVAFWRKSDAYRVLRVFMGSVVGAALLGVVLASGASYYTARWLTDRILRLRDGTSRIADGDLSYRVLDHDEDELGQLARSFNVMGDRLAVAMNRAEEATSRWRALVEHAPDIIVTVDPGGDILFINRVLPGFAVEEVVGTQVFSWIAPDHREKLRAIIDRVLKTGEDGRFEGQGLGPFRELAWYDIRVGPVRQDERIVAVTLIATDITAKRELEEEVLRVSERERERIGRDLHDGLGQILTGVSLLGKGLHNRLAARGASEARDADEIQRLVRDAIEQTRGLARGLFPIGLAEDGLRSAVCDLANTVDSTAGVRCRVEGSFSADGLDPFRASHVFRIVQEAVNNALRHGRGAEITIRLFEGETGWGVVVEDDGVGIPEPLPRGSGIGLRLMHHRAAVAGGSLDVTRRHPHGTIVRCSFARGTFETATGDTAG